MRRMIHRLAGATKILGFVILFISAILSIYVLCFTGSTWKDFSGSLTGAGIEADTKTMLSFQGRYLRALSQAAASPEESGAVRKASATEYFTPFLDMAGEQAGRLLKEEVDAAWKEIPDWLSMETLTSSYEASESRFEERQVKEIFTYLDGLAQVPKKGKLANLKAASAEPAFREAYEAFIQGKEDAPSFASYMEAMEKLVRSFLEEGGTLKDAKTWLKESFQEEDLLAALEDAEEEEVTLSDDLMVFLAEEAMEDGNVEEAMKKVWEELAQEEGLQEDSLLSEATFLASMKKLLLSPSFDGSLDTLLAEMKKEEEEREEGGLGAAIDALSDKVIKEADDRSLIRLVVPFWLACSYFVEGWMIGLCLLLYSFLSNALLNRYLVHQVDKAQKKNAQGAMFCPRSRRGEATKQASGPDQSSKNFVFRGEDITREAGPLDTVTGKEGSVSGQEAPLLTVSHLCQYFQSGSFVNKAVQDVSFTVQKGEVFGLVGESGCGKTTTGRTIIGLYDPTAGDVYFDGLRISSGKNGLPVLEASLKRDAREAIRKAKETYQEEKRLHPEKESELKKEMNAIISDTRKKLRKDLRNASSEALLSEAEKKVALSRYRKKKVERLTAEYEEKKKALELDNKLTKEALAELDASFAQEKKVAENDQIMTRMQMIFQDPIASIDPRMTVREIIAEGLKIRGVKDKTVIDNRVKELLRLVGLVAEHADRYPHEFSGGQRQRIGIARALALDPELIIADEPISALDVSIQAQVINLLNDLRKQMGLTIIFIAHNLSVVKYFSDRIAVMYFGNMVEMASSEELFLHPLHPYTKSLLSAIPYPDPIYEKNRKRLTYDPVRTHDYRTDKPTLREVSPGHFVHCNQAEFEAYQRELKRQAENQ